MLMHRTTQRYNDDMPTVFIIMWWCVKSCQLLGWHHHPSQKKYSWTQYFFFNFLQHLSFPCLFETLLDNFMFVSVFLICSFLFVRVFLMDILYFIFLVLLDIWILLYYLLKFLRYCHINVFYTNITNSKDTSMTKFLLFYKQQRLRKWRRPECQKKWMTNAQKREWQRICSCK